MELGWLSQQSLPYFMHRSFRGVGVAAPETFPVYSRGCLARYSQGLALVGVVALCITSRSSSLPACRPSAGRLPRCAPQAPLKIQRYEFLKFSSTSMRLCSIRTIST